ncbi:hypothetical protein HYW54_03645 [Candidatus Gottesmanbacteria bacterium]|nr:hypothetical protein [Candidatus Gottesmanbacteria bacterium]
MRERFLRLRNLLEEKLLGEDKWKEDFRRAPEYQRKMISLRLSQLTREFNEQAEEEFRKTNGGQFILPLMKRATEEVLQGKLKPSDLLRK